MSFAVTTTNADGQAVFSSKISRQHDASPMPLGRMALLYTTHRLPLHLDSEKDIDQYAVDRENGLGPAVSCPPNGTSVIMIHVAPGVVSPMRKLPTLGVFYILEGQLQLDLDSGDSRTMKAGDAGVLRSATHSWTNETPNGGWAKILSFSQAVEQA